MREANASVGPIAATRPAPAPAPAGRLQELDSTRGIAALVVCLGHCSALVLWPAGAPGLPRWGHALSVRLLDGAAAVDFFFVLSGFVLSLPYVGGRARPLRTDEFVLRRILRIMPTYWAGLLLALLLRFLVAPRFAAIGIPGVLQMDWVTPLTTRQVVELVALIFRPEVTLINGPIWSLQAEMQVSLILPFVIAILALRPTWSGSLTLLVLSIVIPLMAGGGSGLMFLPLFTVGCLMATYRTQLSALFRRLPGPARLGLLGLAGLLVWNRALQPWWHFPDPRQEYLSGLGSALIILLVLGREVPPRFLTRRPIVYLGSMSYSLYLIHLPVLLAAVALLRSVSAPEWLTLPGALACALAVSALLYHAVERPSITLGHRAVKAVMARPWFTRGATGQPT